MESTRQDRLLEIFFRGLRGEDISVSRLADEYEVSTKSITRSINDLKAFLADHRDLVDNTELEYSYQDKCYHLVMDEFLSSRELFSLIEVLIGARAFSKKELLLLIDKMKKFTTRQDRTVLNELIRRELFQYAEIPHLCDSVQQTLWQLIGCIHEQKEITIRYVRMDRKEVVHRIIPASVMFTDYYFYLIAFRTENTEKPVYFRIDRIRDITEHRKRIVADNTVRFDEGDLRRKSLLMWPGPLRRIRFEFSGPSLQAVLDKLPTAKVIDRLGNNRYLIEAEVFGNGIKMWLLSQGSWVKVVEPAEFAAEMKEEIAQMLKSYQV